MFAGSPSKVATVNPAHSASAASSVKSLRPSRAARRWASRITSKRNACGVCAIRNRARSGVASTLPVSPTCLIVSVTGIAGTAAPVRPAASIAREITADVTKGRAASWIRTMSGFSAGERLKAGMHRSLAGRAAIGGRLMAQSGDRFVEEGGVVGIDHRLHRKDIRMPAERLHGAEDHGLPADHRDIALGRQRRREARARLRRGWLRYARVWAFETQSCGRIGVEEGASAARAHSPYHAEYGKDRAIPIAVGKAVFVAVHLHK